jgi:S-adenosylmethionine:tRNA ribosyltransferase-isomerase
LRRDEVRLLVSYFGDGDRIIHTQFADLPAYLNPGDVLVINTSGTFNAALEAKGEDGEAYELHLSTRLPDGRWVVELRRKTAVESLTVYNARAGQEFTLPAGGQLTLKQPYQPERFFTFGAVDRLRLWTAKLDASIPWETYVERFGFPIRYKYVREGWPLSYYQTVYATQKGSAEMPSAGRAFTPELITALVARGVLVVPLLLHTGVASLEAGEPPYEEYFNLPAPTADAINLAHAAGRRVIAVGTTTIRAVESAADPHGAVHPAEGWTDLVITPQRGLRAVDGLLTGFHEPQSSHLAMLAALAGFEHLKTIYREALEYNYLWHEFGDLHLILPEIYR